MLTSGDLALVADDAGGGHSPFASRFLQSLQYSDKPAFGVLDLHTYVRSNLQNHSIVSPLESDHHMPGGEFVFRRAQGVVAADRPTLGQGWTVANLGMEFVWIPAMNCWIMSFHRKPSPAKHGGDWFPGTGNRKAAVN